jgi:AcrR family transcriptional regulator
LQYYFESKEGLHRACVAHLAGQVTERLEEALAAARSGLRAGPERAAQALCRLIDQMLVEAVISERPLPLRRFMARALLDGDGPASGKVLEQFFAPIVQLSADLVAAAMEKPTTDDEARVVAMFLLTLPSGVAPGRLDALGWTDIGKSKLDVIRRVLRRTVLGAIGAPQAPT